jgi:threonine synthase
MNPLVLGLKCRLCGAAHPADAGHFCADDFGPLDVAYDYDAVARTMTREAVARRPWSMWRYRELLPPDPPASGLPTGGTPLVRADALAGALGVKAVWVKNEAVCHPTLSFKDRLVAVALAGLPPRGTVACSSTGNLADSLAAHAAAERRRCFVFVPADLGPERLHAASVCGAKVIAVKGSYDSVNRLCGEAAERYGWGFVNVNLKPYYLEGARTAAFEIAEQLGWRAPEHLVVPVAGGGLLCKLRQGFEELARVGLIEPGPCRVYAAQASGCSPVSTAIKNGWPEHRPVRSPQTICQALAVGDPGDGYFALQAVRGSGGWAEDADDEEIAEGVELLARTEGIYAEAAGGVVVAAAEKLIRAGRIPRQAEVALLIPAHGLKTPAVAAGRVEPPALIGPTLADLETLLRSAQP